MQLEVEQKFWVDDPSATRDRLLQLGARFAAPVDQVDEYFAHPLRNFAETDEALRIRRVGEVNLITYKGPKLDAETKTRRELELPVGSGQSGFDQLEELLVAIGFTPVHSVRKRRQTAELIRNSQRIEIALDDVAGLGHFVEIEASATVATADSARDVIRALALELGLARNERRSYLELLLANPERESG